jgi:hypothetical protein
MDKAGDLLKSFLSFYNLEKGQMYVSLFSGWKDLVGEDIASHARATDIRRGALLVEVDHPGWMQIIQMKQSFILKSIEKKYPELGIRVLHLRLLKEGTPFGTAPAGGGVKAAPRVGEEAEAERSETPDSSIPEKPADIRGDGLEGITDENLKNLLTRLGRTIREKNRRPGRS